MKTLICLIPLLLLGCNIPIDLSSCNETDTRLHVYPRVAGVDVVRVRLVGEGISQECTAVLETREVECAGTGPLPTLDVEDRGLYGFEILGEAYEQLEVSIEGDGNLLFDERVTFEVSEATCKKHESVHAEAWVEAEFSEGAGGMGGGK